MSKTKKIRITQCSSPKYWYAPFVGKEIEYHCIIHDGAAWIKHHAVTELRRKASLDGVVVKGDYELI
jgi:hypothetical protein